MEKDNTHLVATPNKKPVAPPTPIENFKVALYKDYESQVRNYFMGDKDRAMKFMSSAYYVVRTTPALLNCSPESLFGSLMTCAEFGLYPSTASGEAFILPYKDKAQFQLGYKGVVTLLYGAGVQSIHASIVYEKDVFEYEEGLEPRLVHKPNVFGGDRGKPIGVYVVAVVNGEKMFKVMSKDEVLRFKQYSKAKDSAFYPWNGIDPELTMWKKTCLKQLAKFLPMNEKLAQAFEKDNEDSNIPSVQLDAAGPAVGPSFHKPKDLATPKPPEEPLPTITQD